MIKYSNALEQLIHGIDYGFDGPYKVLDNIYIGKRNTDFV